MWIDPYMSMDGLKFSPFFFNSITASGDGVVHWLQNALVKRRDQDNCFDFDRRVNLLHFIRHTANNARIETIDDRSCGEFFIAIVFLNIWIVCVCVWYLVRGCCTWTPTRKLFSWPFSLMFWLSFVLTFTSPYPIWLCWLNTFLSSNFTSMNSVLVQHASFYIFSNIQFETERKTRTNKEERAHTKKKENHIEK